MSRFPDRWTSYTKYGRKVEGTSFIAFKVPLAERFFRPNSPDTFTPESAIREIPKLGMVIDLTFTTKYYDPKAFTSQHVQYVKLFTKGHEIPHSSLVNKFIRSVENFLADDRNKGKTIGVHCTHGLNRTGYFICAYMILAQGVQQGTAIRLFNEARYHKMERANYLDSLHQLIPYSYKRKTNRNQEEHLGHTNNWREGNTISRAHYFGRYDYSSKQPSVRDNGSNGYSRNRHQRSRFRSPQRDTRDTPSSFCRRKVTLNHKIHSSPTRDTKN